MRQPWINKVFFLFFFFSSRQGWCVWFSQQEDTKYDDLYIQMSPFFVNIRAI